MSSLELLLPQAASRPGGCIALTVGDQRRQNDRMSAINDRWVVFISWVSSAFFGLPPQRVCTNCTHPLASSGSRCIILCTYLPRIGGIIALALGRFHADAGRRGTGRNHSRQRRAVGLPAAAREVRGAQAGAGVGAHTALGTSRNAEDGPVFRSMGSRWSQAVVVEFPIVSGEPSRDRHCRARRWADPFYVFQGFQPFRATRK